MLKNLSKINLKDKLLIETLYDYINKKGYFDNKKWFTFFAKRKWTKSYYTNFIDLNNPIVKNVDFNLNYNENFKFIEVWHIDVDFGQSQLHLEGQISFNNLGDIFFSYDGYSQPLRFIKINNKNIRDLIYNFIIENDSINATEKTYFKNLYTKKKITNSLNL